MGVNFILSGILPAMGLLILTSTIAVGIGLSFASFMTDFQSFQIVQNIVIMPMVFLSTAFINVANAPGWLSVVVRLNPFSYGIDGVRQLLVGVGAFPLWLDILVSGSAAVVAMMISSYLFEKIEV